MHQTIVVLDFGSQYTQLIARRIRECNVYSKIYHYSTKASVLAKEENLCGIVLSGGPSSVFARKAPLPDRGIFDLGVPILGICYGLQVMAYMLNGKVEKTDRREYGHSALEVAEKSRLLAGISKSIRVWNSHGDKVIGLPSGFISAARTANSKYAAIEHPKKRFFGLQFHPEVSHTEQGVLILQNFLIKICGCRGDWSMADFLEQAQESIRKAVGDKRVILGLSGGVDSSVAAALIHRAIGSRLHCVFVDNGLLRLHERDAVVNLFKRNFRMNLRVARTASLFLKKLRGVTDPEKKRKIIGRTFIEVFDNEVKSIGEVDFLAQGTLYPDVIESVSIEGNPASLIKSHHNVGGLPKRMKLKLIEPLRSLFKDEVRVLGRELGLPREVLMRQPFPGPGLGVRVLGEVTARNLRVLREADAILIEEMVESGYYYKVWQSFAVFLPVRSVGVMGDRRTYENVIVLRIVESLDAMTADWARLPYEILQTVSTRIINEVKGVNRVCFDISSKPPGTIEWE